MVKRNKFAFVWHTLHEIRPIVNFVPRGGRVPDLGQTGLWAGRCGLLSNRCGFARRAGTASNALPLRYFGAGTAECGDRFCARRSMDMTWGRQDGRHTQGGGTGTRAGAVVSDWQSAGTVEGSSSETQAPDRTCVGRLFACVYGNTFCRARRLRVPGGGSALAALPCLPSVRALLRSLRKVLRRRHRRETLTG